LVCNEPLAKSDIVLKWAGTEGTGFAGKAGTCGIRRKHEMKMDAEVLFSHPFHFCGKYGNMDGVNSFHFKHINLNTAKCFRVFSTSLNFSNQKASMLLAAQRLGFLP